MKKINYGSFVCEVSVDPDYMLLKHGLCDYERDTIAYAVERFFTRCRKAGKACTVSSVHESPEAPAYPSVFVQLPD